MPRRRATRRLASACRQVELDLHAPAPGAGAAAGEGAPAGPPASGRRGAGRRRARAPGATFPTPGLETRVVRDVACSILERGGHRDLGFHARADPYVGAGVEAAGPGRCVQRLRARVDAPALLRAGLTRPAWKAQTVVLGGTADPYPAVEGRLALARGCLEVFADLRHPVAVVTASQLVLRDVDLLADLARERCVLVAVSLGTLDAQRARRLEPAASAPAARLRAIHRLAAAGVPVGVLVGPGGTSDEVPALLRAAGEAGACFARRGAAASGGAGGAPLPGDGRARQVADAFRRAARRLHLPSTLPRLSTAAFRAPAAESLALF